MRKKIKFVMLLFVTLFGTVGCENENYSNIQSFDESKGTSISEISSSIDELKAASINEVNASVNELKDEYSKLTNKVNSYDNFKSNVSEVERYYEQIEKDTKKICIKLMEISVEYAEYVMSSKVDNDDKYDEIGALYDDIYADALNEVFDLIYSDLLDNMFDYYYAGIIDDAYDSVSYSEYSDVKTAEYKRWSDCKSEIYKIWSDAKSEIYSFYSDILSNLWSSDFEDVKEEIEKFKEKIESLEN